MDIAAAKAALTHLDLDDNPAAVRISTKAAMIASVTSCGSRTVTSSVSTAMLSWST